MTVEILRLLIDFGFVILIWAVQLVIYPSFGYYSKSDLVKWHRSYTKRVTFIVLPLMFSQLALSIFHLLQIRNWYTIISLFLVLMLWILTFRVFVPLHFSIDNNKPVENVCKKLVTRNWTRTVLWTSLFLISLIYFLQN
ncbi:hypothetical protein [Winogradskyella sp.]|uniref:hypothetical protein n=1 Tax=Winogradskyella sp. TaxID=1883156 RepID=UPI0026175696|nr:hypothetical protein [Winogradskyella sp.]